MKQHKKSQALMPWGLEEWGRGSESGSGEGEGFYLHYYLCVYTQPLTVGFALKEKLKNNVQDGLKKS